MGLAVSYLAFRGLAHERALERLKLRATGANVRSSRAIAATLLKNGWYAVLFHNKGFREFKTRDLVSLSEGCEVFYGFVEEHVMASHAAVWQDGVERWSVTHDGDEGEVQDLAVRGVPPPDFDAIKQRKFALQERDHEVDYILEIPVKLAESIIGLDVDRDDTAQNYEVLEPVKSSGLFSMFRR